MSGVISAPDGYVLLCIYYLCNFLFVRICYDSFAIFREGSGCNTDNFITYVVVHTNRTR